MLSRASVELAGSVLPCAESEQGDREHSPRELDAPRASQTTESSKQQRSSGVPDAPAARIGQSRQRRNLAQHSPSSRRAVGPGRRQRPRGRAAPAEWSAAAASRSALGQGRAMSPKRSPAEWRRKDRCDRQRESRVPRENGAWRGFGPPRPCHRESRRPGPASVAPHGLSARQGWLCVGWLG
jgi:hypothetical protein